MFAVRVTLQVLHVLGAQHEMRKVDVPRMRGNIRALRHEAHVAEVTVIDDVPVDLLVDTVELERFTRIDRIEESGKRIAERETAPAAVTDIEDALEFFLERSFVNEAGTPPIQRKARGRLQAALAYAGLRGAHRHSFKSCRGPFGNDWRANVRLSRAFRTSRRFRRTLLLAPASPCPDTCRCTRASHRRSRP